MKRSSRVIFVLLCLIIILGIGGAAGAADLIVPSMELITRGYVDTGRFVLGTRGKIDFEIAGGYKVGGRIALGIESDSLADISLPTFVQFKAASVTARNLFSNTINLTYFVGEHDVFADGNTFVKDYGTVPIATDYSGYMYFPTGVQYNGLYTPTGMGLEIATSPELWDRFSLSGYFYQDSYLTDLYGQAGYFSGDIRALVNLEQFKLEGFIGISFPGAWAGLYRAGLLFFYNPGQIGEFLMQVGIPRWDPVLDPFSINLFYFLFEPRLHFDIFSIILTLFWHPEYYNQQSTGELGSADINANFRFGDLDKSPVMGGLETTALFSPPAAGTDQFRFIVSPYFSAVTAGVIWNIKLNVRVFPVEFPEMLEAFIGVKAEF